LPQVIAIGFDEPTPNPLVDRHPHNGGGYEQVAEEYTFRLNAADNISWGREIDPTLETELLRRYLDKDHAFRNGQWNVRNRALIDGDQSITAAWDNMSALFGDAVDAQTHVFYDWRSHASDPNNSYLWAFGGRPGSVWGTGPVDWTGVMDSEFLSRYPSYAVFTEQEGSLSVEWDRSDSVLRSLIANDGYGLTSTWIYGNRFDYYHMGAGGTIGGSLLVTQNRGAEFGQLDAKADVWSALMGDPTLRMHVVAPPTNARTDGVRVVWNPSSDPSVLSYNIYRAPLGYAPGTIAFERIGSVPAATNSLHDPSGSTSGYQYMVRALKRQDGPSGSYYNLSQGAFSHGVHAVAAASAGVAAASMPAQNAANLTSAEAVDLAFAAALMPSGANAAAIPYGRSDSNPGAQTLRDFSNPGTGHFAARLQIAEIDTMAADELYGQVARAGFELVPLLDLGIIDQPAGNRVVPQDLLADELGADFESLVDDSIASATNMRTG
jgi:hypothetical protein